MIYNVYNKKQVHIIFLVITDDSTVKDKFAINANNGSIKIIKELDREDKPEYKLKLKVCVSFIYTCIIKDYE